MKSAPNNATVIDKCTQRLNALKKYVKSNAEIPIGGETHNLADMIKIYQTCLDTRAAITAKRAELKAAMLDRQTAEALRRTADRALKPWVVNTFGADSQAAHDFGFPPNKVPVHNVQKKAHAVAQSKATRTARHTMGKKQKAKIKGTLPPETPTSPPNPQPNAQSTQSNGAPPQAQNGGAPQHV
jgi:hypothetical protein